MARRDIQLVECDGCAKTVEHDSDGADLPATWHHFVLEDRLADGRVRSFEFDVHSPGCGERVAIRHIRSAYGIDEEGSSLPIRLDPIEDDELALT